MKAVGLVGESRDSLVRRDVEKLEGWLGNLDSNQD
tara:strand:+ start:392 stop:496 length:105 start_codon:yes stop_codon:yes gene_type:complete